MIERLAEEESALITGFKEKIEAKFSAESDIPAGLVLTEVNLSPVYKNQIILIRSGRPVVEEWMFKKAPEIEGFKDRLSDLAKEGVSNLAEKLEVEEDTIFKAALLTRTLIEKPDQATAVDLDGGPEVIRLIKTTLPGSRFNGILLPERPGYVLEYYSCFHIVAGEKSLVAIRSLLIHTNHQDASFEEIFPVALLLSATVAEKHKPEQTKDDEAAKLQSPIIQANNSSSL